MSKIDEIWNKHAQERHGDAFMDIAEFEQAAEELLKEQNLYAELGKIWYNYNSSTIDWDEFQLQGKKVYYQIKESENKDE